MDKILKSLFQINEFKFRADDDTVDRLSRHYTPSLLVVFSVLVSIKQYVGEPISCWCPAQFTQSHQEYTNTVCWISNTYYVPFTQVLPLASEPRQHISYYQWVPILLLCQAGMFYIPCTGWRFLNRRTGISLQAIIEGAHNCLKAIYPETKEKTLRFMVLQIDGYLMNQTRDRDGLCARMKDSLSRVCCFFCSRDSGNYLVFIYMLTKFVYIVNMIGQLFVLDVFLGMERRYHLYGIQVMSRLLYGQDWSLSERFPRVTLCDFQIRQQTNVHRYTVQCVLPINLFNEKIFIFVWFWLFFVAITTVVNFFHWLGNVAVLSLQVSYVRQALRSMDLNKRESKAIRKFTEHYLRRDGLLIVRLVAKNAGELVAAELLHGLWLNYGPDRRSLAESRSDPSRKNQGQGRSLLTQENPIRRNTGTRWSMVKRILVKRNSQNSEEQDRDENNFIRVEDI